VVLAAGRSDSTRAQSALARFCQTYWYPLYAYVRRHGHSPHDAQDLTQEFFARLLERHSLACADPNRGRFRSFLLSALDHFLVIQLSPLVAWASGQRLTGFWYCAGSLRIRKAGGSPNGLNLARQAPGLWRRPPRRINRRARSSPSEAEQRAFDRRTAGFAAKVCRGPGRRLSQRLRIRSGLLPRRRNLRGSVGLTRASRQSRGFLRRWPASPAGREVWRQELLHAVRRIAPRPPGV